MIFYELFHRFALQNTIRTMNTAELKVDLFRKLDSLNSEKVKEAYGLITNFINGGESIEEKSSLSSAHKAALQHGIQQLERGEGQNNQEVTVR